MRRLSLALCLILLGIPRPEAAAARDDLVVDGQTGTWRAPDGEPGHAPSEQNMNVRLERLERWLKAVARHTPGVNDDALVEVARWPNANLQELWIDANVLVQMMRGHRSDRFDLRSEGQRTATQVRYTKAQVLRLSVLACAAGGALTETACIAVRAADERDPALRQLAALARAETLRGDDNYILRRGALLHGDVAVLEPQAMAAPASAPSSLGPQRFHLDIADGQAINLGQSAVHWEIARMLLDSVRPRGGDHAAPGRDDMVRQWYRATAAWMQLREDHDKLHLDRARELFPADPDILFLSGCQRETYAGSAIQTAARSAVVPTGARLDVGTDRTELREAEALFRRVLEIKPDHAEARLRHGRVLEALGKQAEAAVELRRAVADLTDRQMLYYAGLFLGAAEEGLGNRDAARVSYEHAAELFPRAQSPLLALSQLARRYGDRGGALRAIDRLFALPAEERNEHDDPWWAYYVTQARDADHLLAAMQQPFLAERLQ